MVQGGNVRQLSPLALVAYGISPTVRRVADSNLVWKSALRDPASHGVDVSGYRVARVGCILEHVYQTASQKALLSAGYFAKYAPMYGCQVFDRVGIELLQSVIFRVACVAARFGRLGVKLKYIG